MCKKHLGGVLFILSLGKSMEIRVVLWPQKLTNMWVNKSERCWWWEMRFPVPAAIWLKRKGLLFFDEINHRTRWWFQILFIFHPYLGKWFSLTDSFQMGWNHQLEKVESWSKRWLIGTFLDKPNVILLDATFHTNTMPFVKGPFPLLVIKNDI